TSPFSKPANEYVNQGASLTATWDMPSEITVKAIGAYRELDEVVTGTDYDNSPYEILTVDIGLTGYRMWSGELQVSGSSFNNTLDWTTGIFAFNEQGLDESFSQFGPPYIQSSSADVENSSHAVFSQANYHFTDELIGTFGLRYSKEEKQMLSKNRWVN